jgi:hypothetical protein
MPFTFIQDDLLKTRDFVKAARERGQNITEENLQDLHSRRLLVPLFRVSDFPVIGRQLDVVPDGNLDARRLARQAASEGQLYDCAEEGYSSAWPYVRPDDEHNRDWWNGFLYSSWQLTDLHRALSERTLLGHMQRRVQHNVPPRELWRRHSRTLALVSLAPRYLPGILGRLSMPGGINRDALEGFTLEADVGGLLQEVHYDPSHLRADAEYLLGQASRDPLRGWLPLVRHASYDAWKKLHGEPLDCLWLRIAAEMLLRAHEELALRGDLEPLPDITGVMHQTALHGRLGRKNDSPKPLEQVLGNFGLSPHPRVLLVIEGKTERLHIKPLLEEFGLSQPEQVRVQQFNTSGASPQSLARYAVTPRIGSKINDAWELIATPTALVIAMDPENKWKTPQKCEEERRKIQQAIREEVELLGGKISDDSLDFQVTIFTWGEDKYELANFTDDELVSAIAQLAKGSNVGSPSWMESVRSELLDARMAHSDIKIVTGPLRVQKTQLAKLLWPVLLAKCQTELTTGKIETPILKVVLKVQELVARLSGGSYVLPPPESDE